MAARQQAGWKRVLGMVVLVIVVLAPPVAFVLGSIEASHEEDLLATGTHVSGTVVHFDDANKASDRDVVVRYTASDGVPRTVRAMVPHDQHPVPGQEVTVVHDPADPGRALIEGYDTWARFAQGLGFFITLLLTVPYGVGLVWRAARRRREARRQGHSRREPALPA